MKTTYTIRIVARVKTGSKLLTEEKLRKVLRNQYLDVKTIEFEESETV